MSNENKINNEQEIKLSELEKENNALRSLLFFDLLHPWEGIFTGKTKTFQIESYADFKNYLNAFNNLKEKYSSGINSYDYRITMAINSLFVSLLNNEKYKEMTTADFEAADLLEILKKIQLSQKNKATAMRHCKIDNDTYLENVEIFSPFFNTLKKYNPDLKAEEVKLINEISGKKKSTASKLEKLQRGEGRLTAYKSYTPQETAQYPDSFNFYTILHCYKNDNLGRRARLNEEVLNYYLSDGTETFRDVMKGADRYTYNNIFNLVNNPSSTPNSSYYWNSTQLFDRIYDDIDYCGNIPFNNVYPVWEISVKALKENPNETLKSYNNTGIHSGRLFGLIALYKYLSDFRRNVYFFRNILSVDLNYISEKEIKTLFLHLKTAELFMSKNTTLKGIFSSDISTYDSRQRLSRICENTAYNKNILFSQDIISEATKFTDEIMEYFNKAKNNEKLKDFINSEKYWTEFCTPISIKDTFFSEFNFTHNSNIVGVLNKQAWKNFIKCLEEF